VTLLSAIDLPKGVREETFVDADNGVDLDNCLGLGRHLAAVAALA
jgi:hypothetical protein